MRVVNGGGDDDDDITTDTAKVKRVPSLAGSMTFLLCRLANKGAERGLHM